MSNTQATRRPVPADLYGGRLRGAFLLNLEVVGLSEASPHVRVVTVGSSDLIGFEYVPGQDLMIEFPVGGNMARRRYTIRRADATAGTVDLEFELYPDAGPAGQWARRASVGDHLDAIGPRGSTAARPDRELHVFVADDSSMPTAFAIIDALPADAQATALLVTPHGEGSRPGPTRTAGVALHWVEALPAAATPFLGPLDDAAGYVLGERQLVRDGVLLLRGAGTPESALSSKAYWRRDQANLPHGEPAGDMVPDGTPRTRRGA